MAAATDAKSKSVFAAFRKADRDGRRPGNGDFYRKSESESAMSTDLKLRSDLGQSRPRPISDRREQKVRLQTERGPRHRLGSVGRNAKRRPHQQVPPHSACRDQEVPGNERLSIKDGQFRAYSARKLEAAQKLATPPRSRAEKAHFEDSEHPNRSRLIRHEELTQIQTPSTPHRTAFSTHSEHSSHSGRSPSNGAISPSSTRAGVCCPHSADAEEDGDTKNEI